MAEPRGAQLIPTGVDGDGDEPRLGIFALAQGVQALVGLEEDLLRGVLGQRPILQNDIAKAQNVVAVGLHQLGEPFILLCARNRGVLHVVHLLIY